jgi:hypothetical protein
MIKPITQNHILGCGVACVASIIGASYARALSLFANPTHAQTKGFYCRDLVAALKKRNKFYAYKFLKSNRDPILKKPGTIVYTLPNQKYHRGHYLVRTQNGWMNPWVNCPEIASAKSGIVKRLPAKANYAVFEVGQN